MDQQRLKRVFDIMELLATGPATVSGISKALEIPLSSSHDLLQAMLKLDAVSLRERQYSLGPRAISMSLAMVNSIRVQQIAKNHLGKLAREARLDCYLAVRTGSRVLYVSRFKGARAVDLDIPLGRALYLHSTSVGKLFAAFDSQVHQRMRKDPRPQLTLHTTTSMDRLELDLRRIRSAGISISRGESVPGIVGAAAPVRDPDGQLVAAAHMSIVQAAVPSDELRDAVAMLRKSTSDIEDELRQGVSDSLSDNRTA